LDLVALALQPRGAPAEAGSAVRALRHVGADLVTAGLADDAQLRGAHGPRIPAGRARPAGGGRPRWPSAPQAPPMAELARLGPARLDDVADQRLEVGVALVEPELTVGARIALEHLAHALQLALAAQLLRVLGEHPQEAARE